MTLPTILLHKLPSTTSCSRREVSDLDQNFRLLTHDSQLNFDQSVSCYISAIVTRYVSGICGAYLHRRINLYAAAQIPPPRQRVPQILKKRNADLLALFQGASHSCGIYIHSVHVRSALQAYTELLKSYNTPFYVCTIRM